MSTSRPSLANSPATVDAASDLSRYKGEISKCAYCGPESRMTGRACTWCMGRGYLAQCLNCKGTGKVDAGSAWDGGKSSHVSTCAPCSGKGTFPASEADYNRQQAMHPVAISDPVTSALKSLPKAVVPMPNLDITRPR